MESDLLQYKDSNDNDTKANKSEKSRLSFLPKSKLYERTFSWCLLLISSAIVIGTLFINYGQSPILKGYTSSLKELYSYHFHDIWNVLQMPTDLINHFNNYIIKYKWFLKALFGGVGITSFTWFIIYKDSNIPGVNPPAPFSPTKKKITDETTLSLNYLIGIVNGVLIFIYMCF